MIVKYAKLSSRHVMIPYQSEGFPVNTVKCGNGRGCLVVTLGDILLSAITIGRPNYLHVFKHGESSVYEAIFRWSLIKMALRTTNTRSFICLTNAAMDLDPTEKGMVNYFLGMTLCKLFSSRFLNTPWVLYHHVFRRLLNLEFIGRSRPDLVGVRANKLYVFECKGRTIPPANSLKNDAKQQVRRVSVNGIAFSLHVVAITYFFEDVINFYWCDPPPPDDTNDHADLHIPGDVWENYYGIVADLITPGEGRELTVPIERGRADGHWYARIEQCDLTVVVHRLVADHLVSRDWGQARSVALNEDLTEGGFHADGLQVRAGDSWYQGGGEDAISARGE